MTAGQGRVREESDSERVYKTERGTKESDSGRVYRAGRGREESDSERNDRTEKVKGRE